MVLPEKLERFLEQHKVNYEIQRHPRAVTALETAEAQHISGKKLAKVIMVKIRGRDSMVVLPGDRVIDLLKLSHAVGTQDVRIEDEKEFKDLFPDCEAGAMPPFGKIYGVPCYGDQSLAENEDLYFNAGSHTEIVKISTVDFMIVSNAVVGDFSVKRK